MIDGLFAIVPVKSFAEGKSRLHGCLADGQRRALNRDLLDHTLGLVSEVSRAGRTIVISASAEVRGCAERRGMIALADPTSSATANDQLNEALASATALAQARGALGLFVLPVDLPFLDSASLRHALERAPDAPTCMLISDQHGEGTNLLYQCPVRLTRYQFGPGSCARHAAAAKQVGLAPRVIQPGDSWFDLDLPADYERWRAARISPRETSLG